MRLTLAGLGAGLRWLGSGFNEARKSTHSVPLEANRQQMVNVAHESQTERASLSSLDKIYFRRRRVALLQIDRDYMYMLDTIETVTVSRTY